MIVAEKKKKQGRNEPCACRSGKKYKKCCGAIGRMSEGQHLRLSSDIQEAVRHHKTGNLQAAEEIYRRVLSIDKNNVDALHLLGEISCQRKDYENAIDLIQQAININQTSPVAYTNLGIALRETGKLEAALDSFIHAIELNSDYLSAYDNLADTIKRSNHLDERSLSYLMKGLSQEKIRPEAKYGILVMLGYVIESPREWNKNIFEKCVLPATKDALDRGDHFFAYYLSTLTAVSYAQQPHTGEQWRACHELTNPMYISAGEKLRKNLNDLVLPEVSDQLPVIGFIVDLSIGSGSGATVIINLLRGFSRLSPKPFQSIVYTLDAVSIDLQNACLEIGVKLVNFSKLRGMLSSEKDLFQRLLALRFQIQADKVTALIYPGTYEAFPCFAASIGMAPVQIYFSMGFLSIHVPKMDAYISILSPVKSKRMLEGKEWRMGPLSSPDPYPEAGASVLSEINEEVRSIREKQFAPDVVILGSLCRPQKIEQLPFIKTLACILRANPKAVFLWFGPTELPSVRQMMEAQGISNRCLFQGWVDIKIYAKLLDIHLDPFPYPNGLSMLDTLSASTASVCMKLDVGIVASLVPLLSGEGGLHEEQERVRKIFTHPKTEENLALCADSEDEYVAYAQRLVDDKDYRAEVGKAGRRFMELFRHDPSVAGRAFAEHFIEIINECREKIRP